MENRKTTASAPPRMMNAIIVGFNVVANHLALLILPVVLDLFLLLGPQFRIKSVFSPFIAQTLRALEQANSPDITAMMNGASEIWYQFLDSFNLFSLIRTLPIGVPSLMAAQGVVENPLGAALEIEGPDLTTVLLIALAIILLGFTAGSLYYFLLARFTSETSDSPGLKDFFKKTGQAIELSIGFFLFLAILIIPGLLLVSAIALINQTFGNFALLFAGFLLVWILFPLIFTPQALFAGKSNLLVSVMTSVRVVRQLLPGASVFIIVGLLFTQGMDVLWRVPPTSSWMVLVGIFGHAFIYTAIYAASFVYFRSGLHWMLENVQSVQAQEIKT